MIKVDEVKKRVEFIASLTNAKDSVPHCLEDDLFFDVLNAIAAGAHNGRALAREAIKSAELDIPRRYE